MCWAMSKIKTKIPFILWVLASFVHTARLAQFSDTDLFIYKTSQVPSSPSNDYLSMSTINAFRQTTIELFFRSYCPQIPSHKAAIYSPYHRWNYLVKHKCIHSFTKKII